MSETDADPGITEIRAVWYQLQRTDDPDEREILLERLAEVAFWAHDFSDLELHEDLHAQFERLRRAREDYHLCALRVGRTVARLIDEDETRAAMQAHADSSEAN